MPRSKKRGTADLELGQYNEVLEKVVRVLPKALTGIPYGDLKGLLGDVLEPVLHQAFLNAIQEQTRSSPKNMELVEFLEQGEFFISGDELCRRAKKLNANSDLEQARDMLARQDEILEEFCSYRLVFPSDRGVSHLFLNGSRWCLKFDCPERNFDSQFRLVRFRK